MSTLPQRAIVLAGGTTPERDVSLRSGRRVAAALRSAAEVIDVVEHDVDASLLEALATGEPTVVVPLLHGSAGEDGVVPDLLQAMGIPYVGSTPQACRLAFDKPVAKTIVARSGVQTPASLVIPLSAFRELGATTVMTVVVEHLGLPLVVKPTRGGSSLGVEVVREPDELPSAMVRVFAYGDTAMLERHVSGVEVAVSVLEGPEGGLEVLPPVEIVPDRGFYDYESRYTAGTTEFFVPARLDDALITAVSDVARSAHRALGLRDWSRTDLIVDAAGTPWFLEVNVAPGMTETSLFPQSLAAAGQDLGAVVRRLVTEAFSRPA